MVDLKWLEALIGGRLGLIISPLIIYLSRDSSYIQNNLWYYRSIPPPLLQLLQYVLVLYTV